MVRNRRVSTQQKSLSYEHVLIHTPEEPLKCFPLCIKLRCSKFNPMQKVSILFPITELNEAPEIWKSIQISAYVSYSMSAGARKHDFHYQITALYQEHWRDQDLTSISLSSLLSTSGHFVARMLCWHSLLLWSTLYEMISKKCISLLLTCKNWGWWRTSNWPL